MQKNVIKELIKEAKKSPILEYIYNFFLFIDSLKDTIRQVKRRLGILQTLEGEIDYQLTISHTEDEEFI